MQSMDDLERITTTEAAAILGCSRQHVVNLCNRGELASTSVGRHRRLRRADVESYGLRRTIGEMTRDQLRSLWLHRAVAGRIATDPAATLGLARENARRRLASGPASGSARSLRGWLRLIDQGPEPVMQALTSTSNAARDLRQSSPFAGVLSEPERLAILRSFQEAHALN
jgi:excisionase family DNA binding protein